MPKSVISKIGWQPSVQKRGAALGERVMGALFPNRGVGWPGGWGQDRLEQVGHMKNWTYVAINSIASKMAQMMPNLAYVSAEEKPGKTQKRRWSDIGRYGGSLSVQHDQFHYITTGAYTNKALSAVKPHEELEPLEMDHPLRRLIENPNAVDSSFDLFYELDMFLELCGVSYLWAVPNDWGVPCELWVIPSHWVWPRTGGASYVRPDNPWADNLIQWYEVRPWGGFGSAGIIRLPPNEVVMINWKSPLNKIDGYSKLWAIAQWIDSEESISRSRWSQFQNQARPELWVELGDDFQDPNDDRIARMEAKFMSRFMGEFNYGRPIWTPPGAKLTPLSFNPTEMAYFQCLDEKTECLTANGWKKYTELTKDTRVACYDEKLGKLVYRKPSKITINKYKGKMHQWKGSRVDALMTPNHRVRIKRDTTYSVNGKRTNGACWDIKRVDELAPSMTYGILSAAPAACDTPTSIEVGKFGGWRQRDDLGFNHIRPEVWLRFLGYYLSEGCLTTPTRCVDALEVNITQKKNVDSFRDGILATPFRWSERQYGSLATHWVTSDKGLCQHLKHHCGAGSFNKRIPDYVKAWPAEYLRVLLDALIEGDGMQPRHTRGRGTKNKKAGWSSQYYTRSKQLADDVMEISVKCGLTSSISTREDKREKYKGRLLYVINIGSRTELDVTPSNRSEVDYDGDVWCVTVPTGLFVVRRNGKAHITGNSEEQIRDMILSCFGVPKAWVGQSDGMTYGSVLAVLANFCSAALCPRLAMLGQKLTKDLACRFPDKNGVKGRIRLWWDDPTPHDPQQINADIQLDYSCQSITPNEIRTLRGRKPYRNGGDDPMVQGPGGVVPLPLNTGEDLSDLAKLIAPMEQAQGQGPDEGAQGGEGADQSGEGFAERNDLAPGQDDQPPDMTDTDVEEPNGEPSKGWVNRIKGLDPNSLRVGEDVRFLSHRGTVVDYGQYRDLKAKYPEAIVVAGRDADESKFGRCWAIQFDDGLRLVGSYGIRLLLSKQYWAKTSFPDVDQEEVADKEFWANGRSNAVYIVDGFAVRNLSLEMEEFGKIGTHVEYPMIPEGEVWISDVVPENERAYVLANGERQMRVFEQTHDVDKAVSAGISAEQFERDKHEPKEYRMGNIENVKVRLLQKIKDHGEPLEVWLVNGRMVRDTFETEFVEGANSQALTYVPTGEIWLDDQVDEKELPFILLHERVERCMMKHEYLTYEEAHKEASAIEFQARKEAGLVRNGHTKKLIVAG